MCCCAECFLFYSLTRVQPAAWKQSDILFDIFGIHLLFKYLIVASLQRERVARKTTQVINAKEQTASERCECTVDDTCMDEYSRASLHRSMILGAS